MVPSLQANADWPRHGRNCSCAATVIHELRHGLVKVLYGGFVASENEAPVATRFQTRLHTGADDVVFVAHGAQDHLAETLGRFFLLRSHGRARRKNRLAGDGGLWRRPRKNLAHDAMVAQHARNGQVRKSEVNAAYVLFRLVPGRFRLPLLSTR